MAKVKSRRDDRVLNKINAGLKKYRGQLAMVVNHDTHNCSLSGSNNFQTSTKLTIFRVDYGEVVDLIGDVLFQLPTPGLFVVLCVRESNTGCFTLKYVPWGFATTSFPIKSLMPATKRAINRITGEELKKLFESNDQDEGLFGNEAVYQWFLNDYFEHPKSNAGEALAFIVERFKIETGLGLPRQNEWKMRLSRTEEQIVAVDGVIKKSIPVELKELKLLLEHDKKQLDSLLYASTKRRGG